MDDKRMPADTARKMIESEKRKVQKQAVPRVDPGFDLGQEMFLKEMREAEAKGDLPPATVLTGSDAGSYAPGYEGPYYPDERPQIIRSMKGGETPTEALETYDKAEDRLKAKTRALGTRLERVMAKIAPDMDADSRQQELAPMLDLIATGKVTINDPELQKEAFEAATAIRKQYKSSSSPEGYVPAYGYGSTTKSDAIRGEAAPLREAIKKGELE